MKQDLKERYKQYVIKIVICAVFLAISFYPWMHAITIMNKVIPALLVPTTIIYMVLNCTIFSCFSPVMSSIQHITRKVGAYWMGIWTLLLESSIVLDSVTIILRIYIPDMYFYTSILVLLTTVILYIYGVSNNRKSSTTIYTVSMNVSQPLNIVHISDLHIGSVTSESTLSSTIKQINELHPDIICITGDIFDCDYNAMKNPDDYITILMQLQATYGVFACLGNHDTGYGKNDAGCMNLKMIELLEKSNITILMEDTYEIPGVCTLVGRLDAHPIGKYNANRLSPSEFKHHKLDVVNPALPIVVMDHTPSHLHEYQMKDTLVLSGHTHKGQIFPANLITKRMFPVHYGRKDFESGMTCIVTSGCGSWGMPLRIGSTREVAYISIQPKEDTKTKAE